jgi:hypothetical protein
MLRTIEEWTSEAVDFGLGATPQDPAWACMDAQCPPDLELRLIRIDEPREIFEIVVKHEPLAHVATTFLTTELTLGSINHQDTWNQRRNDLAYWGTTDEPSCLKVRIIYDGYDLSTGAIWTQQDKHRILGAITFAMDGGGKHLSLEKLVNGTFEAEELALRFEFSGAAASASIKAPKSLDDPVFQGIDIGVQVPYASFTGRDLKWESVESEDGACLDVTIHRGEKQTFVLPDIEGAVIAFALQVGGPGTIGPAMATKDSDSLSVEWNNLGFTVPTKPDTYESMRGSVSGLF